MFALCSSCEQNIICITLKSYKHDVWGQSKYSVIGDVLVLFLYVVCILIHTVAKMDHALTPYFIIAA